MALQKPRYPRLQTYQARAKGIIGAWPLYEGAGQTVHDLSGNGRNGTFVNAPTWIASPFGTAINFSSASSQEINVPYNVFGGLSAFTVAGWERVYSSFESCLASHWNGAGDNQVLIRGGPAVGSFQFYTFTTSQVGGVFSQPSSVVLNVGEWHRFVYVYDGAQMRFYIDAVPSTTTFAQTGQIAASATSYVHICGGSSGSGSEHYQNGPIADVVIANYAWSQADIDRDFADSFRIYRQPSRLRLYSLPGSGGSTISVSVSMGATAAISDQATGHAAIGASLGAAATDAASTNSAIAPAVALGTQAAVAETVQAAMHEAVSLGADASIADAARGTLAVASGLGADASIADAVRMALSLGGALGADAGISASATTGHAPIVVLATLSATATLGAAPTLAQRPTAALGAQASVSDSQKAAIHLTAALGATAAAAAVTAAAMQVSVSLADDAGIAASATSGHVPIAVFGVLAAAATVEASAVIPMPPPPPPFTPPAPYLPWGANAVFPPGGPNAVFAARGPFQLFEYPEEFQQFPERKPG